jgi:hypothetical protein
MFSFSFPTDQKKIVPYLHLKVKVKGNLMGYRAENLSELLVRIQIILRDIMGEILVEASLKWMKQSQSCIAMNGELVG